MRKTLGYAKVYDATEYAREVEQAYMLARNKIGADEEGTGESGDEAEAEET